MSDQPKKRCIKQIWNYSSGFGRFSPCRNPAKHGDYCGVHRKHESKPEGEARYLYKAFKSYGEVVKVHRAEILRESFKQFRVANSAGAAFMHRTRVGKRADGSPEIGSLTAMEAVIAELENKQEEIAALESAATKSRSELAALRKLLGSL